MGVLEMEFAYLPKRQLLECCGQLSDVSHTSKLGTGSSVFVPLLVDGNKRASPSTFVYATLTIVVPSGVSTADVNEIVRPAFPSIEAKPFGPCFSIVVHGPEATARRKSSL